MGWCQWTHDSKTGISLNTSVRNQRSKKNMACCQNRLWRLICCFYRTKSWEQKTGTLPHLALDIANFLGNFILFRHQSMCTINLFFRIQFNGIIFLIKLNLYPFYGINQCALYFSPFSLFNFLQ